MNTLLIKFVTVVGVLGLTGLSSNAIAQEGSFSDYKQPTSDFVSFKGNFDTLQYGSAAVTEYGPVTSGASTGYHGSGLSISQWPISGLPINNGTTGVVVADPVIPEGRDVPSFDVRFMYNAATGAPKKFRIDLYNLAATSVGSVGNGGLIDLTAAGSWRKAIAHRTNDLNLLGVPLQTTQIRIVAIQDGVNAYPAFGTYDRSAAVVFDNIRVTVPRKLSGLYRLTGNTNVLGMLLFTNAGNQLLSSVQWAQTIGDADFMDVFGATDFAGTGQKNSTNVPFAYVDTLTSNVNFATTRFSTSLQTMSNSSIQGTFENGLSVSNRIFSYSADPDDPTATYMLRQTNDSGVYSHSIRASRALLTASETVLNLGSEPIVGIADINGDGADDFVTRLGNTLRARTFQSYSGPNDAGVAQLGSPFTLSTYGNLSCFTAADLNDDGFEDLVLWDTNLGDVFSLICTPSGSTLRWLFRLNPNERLLAVTDADNDGCPDVYCVRNLNSTVGAATIRKMASDGLSVLGYDLVFQYACAMYQPVAVGDANGDGSADLAFIGNDAPDYSVYTCLVNPSTRNILGTNPYWICSAYTPRVRPIFYHGLN